MKDILAITLIASFTALAVHAGDEKADLEKLQGTWTVVSLTEEGKAVPAAEIAELMITIEKDEYTATVKDKAVAKYRFKIDPSKKPATIDFTPLLGKEKEKIIEQAIYVFEKDQLKICIDETGKTRPTVFEGKGTETCSVIVLKKKDAK
jgi:uncharacterized protein (TIGR03067 family)